jgi:hypothetical protein
VAAPTRDLAEHWEHLERQPTAVYRLSDRAGALLYVGMTHDVTTRWREHRRRKAWWDQVAREDFTWYPTRGQAEEAELHAIVTEDPRHNTVWAQPWAKASYRCRWLRRRLAETEQSLNTRAGLRTRAGQQALAEVRRQRDILRTHTPVAGLAGDGRAPRGGVHGWDSVWLSWRKGWCGGGVWPVAAVVAQSRWRAGWCPVCPGQPVPCPVVCEIGAPYRNHPYYCLN